MKRLVLLLCALAACRAPPVEPSAAPLSSPPQASDLDPDPNVLSVRLRAERAPGEPLRYYYNGSSPGPTLRAKLGDTLRVVLDNGLTDATTIHWHGLHVPFAMDGATWMSDPIAPGASFEYEFVLEHAGTFWYHPHFDTEQQVDAGLYGALIVEDPAEPRADDELVLIFDTEPDGREAGAAAHGLGRLHTRWRVNGELSPHYAARGGSSVRARLINASNTGYLALRWPGLLQIGSDQGLLSAAAHPSRLLLAPGDRADVEWDIGETGFDLLADPYSLNGGDTLGEPMPIARVDVSAPAPAPAGLAWPFDGAAVSPDSGSTEIVYAIAGSDRSAQWLLNGARFPNGAIEELALGSRVTIEVRNLSATEHPFHIHGLAFELLSINGVPPDQRTIEDTINVRIRERVRLSLLADNPGEWMAHCHILPHQEDGLMTILRVR